MQASKTAALELGMQLLDTDPQWPARTAKLHQVCLGAHGTAAASRLLVLVLLAAVRGEVHGNEIRQGGQRLRCD